MTEVYFLPILAARSSRSRCPAGPAPSEGSVSGFQVAAFLLCPHVIFICAHTSLVCLSLSKCLVHISQIGLGLIRMVHLTFP